MDNHDKKTRSYNMSMIRSKNTKPEELVRKYLFSQGFRYRKNVRKLEIFRVLEGQRLDSLIQGHLQVRPFVF